MSALPAILWTCLEVRALSSAISDPSPSLINRVSPPVHYSALSEDHKLLHVSLLQKNYISSIDPTFHKSGNGMELATEYDNFYSPVNGLIGAYNTHKTEFETVFWSDVTFALWQSITSLASGNINNLRYIARVGIYNAFTESIMYAAVPESQSQKLTVFGPGDEAFLALLGTPNGAGGVYLLMQHKLALGFKTISRVLVVLTGSKWEPFLIFEVVDMSCLGGSDGVPGAAGLNASLSGTAFEGLPGMCSSLNESRTTEKAADGLKRTVQGS